MGFAWKYRKQFEPPWKTVMAEFRDILPHRKIPRQIEMDKSAKLS